MYEPQHFVDLQENATSFGDPDSWLSGDSNLSPTHRRNQPSLASAVAAAAAAGEANGNVDRALFNDLVQIVPLVQSLIVSSLYLDSFSWFWEFGGSGRNWVFVIVCVFG